GRPPSRRQLRHLRGFSGCPARERDRSARRLRLGHHRGGPARAAAGRREAIPDEMRHAATDGAPGGARGTGGRAVSAPGESCRPDFPILGRLVNGAPLAYLDSAASSQKPRQVIEAVRHYYERSHANVHRSIHTLGEEATELYEAARDAVRTFV